MPDEINDIDAAVRTLKKKNGEAIPYRVYIHQTDEYCIDVEAKNEAEAEELAWDEFNGGCYDSNTVDTSVHHVEENDDEDI